MKKVFLLICIAPCFLKAQTSTITGNVIVNFNYTRNDADVGDDVKLFNIGKKYSLGPLDRDSVIKTTTDILGNYIFKNVAAGDYIIYINSKGAIVDPFYLYNHLKGTISGKLKAVTGFDFATHRPDLQTEIDLLFKQTVALSEDKKFKKYEKANKQMANKIQEWIDAFPSEIKLFLDIFSGQMAKEFKEVSIKPGIDENYNTIFKVIF